MRVSGTHRQTDYHARARKGKRLPADLFCLGGEPACIGNPTLPSPDYPERTTKNAIATYWQAIATSVSAWKSSWYPKIEGTGSGFWRA